MQKANESYPWLECCNVLYSFDLQFVDLSLLCFQHAKKLSLLSTRHSKAAGVLTDSEFIGAVFLFVL
jgi:uncharacterized protein YhbP (UPF0306 family)